jgi:hypothetical protein
VRTDRRFSIRSRSRAAPASRSPDDREPERRAGGAHRRRRCRLVGPARASCARVSAGLPRARATHTRDVRHTARDGRTRERDRRLQVGRHAIPGDPGPGRPDLSVLPVQSPARSSRSTRAPTWS